MATPRLADWMTPVDRDILERLWNERNRDLQLTPSMIAENVDWGHQAVREHVLTLHEHDLIEYADEDRGVYKLSKRGRKWLEGELPTEELEDN
ncbi:homolog to phage PhiH1 repressor protein [Halobacterium hubeiense]|uniref:Homolog to phage PhiH1 repressor protein n=1 Tax=Halobacterium hubeiense TaxID=1407499 RepID=A0A0U5D108_9EURY|nr:ArsR family transcriptional regulator [Halobacterium hubeiense]CQH61645.1 homolog to phage PhiH1 repressor protein [Halobacterium hubeiense]